MEKPKKVIFIVGPTSSGKTDIAISLAKKFNGELISADSRQVYTGLDIGTGKDKSYPHYLIDVVDPGRNMFSLGEFLKRTRKLIPEISSKNHIPIVVGGTGLYISGLLKGYELPTSKMSKGEWRKKNKPDFDALVIGIDVPREELYNKIDRRLKDRMDAGLIDEVRGLISSGVDMKWLEGLGLEYKFVTWYLQGKIASQGELYEKLRYAIHAYARRQLTWLRHQVGGVEWVSGYEEAEKKVNKFLNTK